MCWVVFIDTVYNIVIYIYIYISKSVFHVLLGTLAPLPPRHSNPSPPGPLPYFNATTPLTLHFSFLFICLLLLLFKKKKKFLTQLHSSDSFCYPLFVFFSNPFLHSLSVSLSLSKTQLSLTPNSLQLQL